MPATSRPSPRRHILLSGLAVLAGLVWTPLVLWQPRPENRTYRVGFNHAPPYYLLQPDGRPSGMAVDVMNDAARRANIRLEWVKAYLYPDGSRSDDTVEIWPAASATVERRHHAHFTAPWIQNNFCLLSRRLPGPVRSIGHRTGPTPSAMVLKYFPATRAVEFPSRETIVDAVCQGVVDAGLIEARYLDTVLLARPRGCEQAIFKVDIVPGATTDLHIMSTLPATTAADALRSAISDMAADGTLASIIQRWSSLSSADTGVIGVVTTVARRRNMYRVLLLLAFVFVSTLLWQLWRIRSAELRAREAQTAAERANAAKTDFLANMSHEIRTPLNGVMGMTHLALDGTLDESKRPLLETVQEAARALLTIINDILDFSKIEAGQMRLERSPFRLDKVLSAVVELFRHATAGKAVAIRLDYAPGLATGFLGDEGRVRQIVANFLSNAVKFTSKGEIVVSASELNGMVRLAVRDSGIGIAPEILPVLFTKFTQADASTTRQYGGTGLGLAIAKRLAGLMDGTVGVESVLGAGSTFWADLALVPDCPVRVVAAPRRTVQPVDTGAHRILVAEDNRVNREVLRRLLEKYGCVVDLATNGLEAVRSAGQKRYDLILMDCQMPEMDGYEATAQIRTAEAQSGRRTPIVAVTAGVMATEVERCRNAGMDDHMSKPVNAADLYRCIDTYCSTNPTECSASSQVRT